jgi:type IV secretion system protein TrbI
MSSVNPTMERDAAAVDPNSAVELRGPPPRVMRLSRKAIGIASACGLAAVGSALIFALRPEGQADRQELYNVDGAAIADNLAGAPKDYGSVPKLGPPLPGDLGKPILDAQRRGDVAELPPIGAPLPAVPQSPPVNAAELARQRAEQERETARGSDLFFGGARAASSSLMLSHKATQRESRRFWNARMIAAYCHLRR